MNINILIVVFFVLDIILLNVNLDLGFLVEIKCNDFDNFFRFFLRDELRLVYFVCKIIE